MSEQDYLKLAANPLSATSDTTLDVDELHMRETLGLSGRPRLQSRPQQSAPAKQRHRFIQDGEVQVVHLSGQRDNDSTATFRGRITTLEAALEAEHAARTKAEQATHSAMAQIHALETKLAHVEMSAKEMVAAERHAREQVESELRLAAAAHDAALQDLRNQPPRAAVEPPAAPEKVKRRLIKAKAAPRTTEPQPVKWWLAKSRG